MARSFVRRHGRMIAFGGGAFAWSAIMFSVGVFTFTYVLSVAHVAVEQYEVQYYNFLEMSETPRSHKQFANPFHAAEELESAPFTHVARHLLAVSEEQKKAEEQSGKAIIEFKRNLPRYNLHGQRVNNTFNPTDVNYYESLVVMIIPCAAISILSCITCCCFFVCRQCCNLCGGKQPKEGGYSLKERYIPKQLLIAIGLIAIVTCVFGWIGNKNFSDGLLGVFDVVDNTTNKVILSADNIERLLLQIQTVNGGSAASAINSLKEGVTTVQDQADNARGIVDQVNKVRETVINAGYVLSALAAVFGMVGSILNKGKLCLVMTIGGFLSLTFLWMSFGLHLPTSILMADACDAIDQFINQQTASDSGNATSSSNFGLESLLSCVKNDSYAPTLDLSYQGLDESLANLNNYTMSCCNISFDSHNVTLLNVSAFPSNLQPQINSSLNDYIIFLQILEELKPYLNCSFIRQAYNDIDYTLCVTMLKGVDMIMGTQGLMGTAFIPGVYLAILGWKRLSHPKTKKKPDEEEMESQVNNPKYGEHYEDDPNNPYNDGNGYGQPQPYTDVQMHPHSLHDSVPPPPPTDPHYPEQPPGYPPSSNFSQAPPIQHEMPPDYQQPPPYVDPTAPPTYVDPNLPRASVAPYQEYPSNHLSIQPHY